MQIIIFPRQTAAYYENAVKELKRLGSKKNPCDEEFCPICAKSHGDLISFVQSLKTKAEES